MSSIQKTAKGYRVQLYVKGHRESAVFATKKEAQIWSAQKEIELRTISKGKASTIKTTHDAFERYSSEISPTHKGERWEVVRLQKMKRDFPLVILEKLSQVHVQKWRDQRLTEVSPSSVLREMKLLSSVFEQCRKEWRWLTENPCKDVRKPSSPPHRERVITRSEIRLILRSLDYPKRITPRHAVAHAFLLALRTGMRQSELAGIQWTDVHPNFVRLPDTKNGTVRDVPLSTKAKRVLEKMRGYHDTSVFGLAASSIDTQFRAAKSRANLSGFVWHDSRHTAATWIGMSGKLNLMEFCKMMGWKDPRHALVYFNPTASDLAAKLL